MSPLNLPILATAALVTLAISSASARPCADILKLKSSGSDREAVLTVKNNTGSEMAFDWINFDGQRENYGRVGPNETTKIQTFVGHVWVFADETNTCVEGFVAADSNNSVTLTRAATVKAKPENRAREAYVPTKSFAKRDINGFTFLVHPDLTSDQALFAEMVAEFTKQTQNILQVLPAEKSQILKSVSIWVDRDEDPDDVAIFYNSRRWLVQQGLNPDKVGSVGILNSKNFITAAKRNQPMIILHELAHAYHFKFSKRLDKKVIKAYRSALAAGTYENVEYSTGDRRRAYALTSKDEYFAELTEAYFGTNDFFPFNREDLERHDRAGYELMEFAWEK